MKVSVRPLEVTQTEAHTVEMVATTEVTKCTLRRIGPCEIGAPQWSVVELQYGGTKFADEVYVRSKHPEYYFSYDPALSAIVVRHASTPVVEVYIDEEW